jgi:hypothetical protein
MFPTSPHLAELRGQEMLLAEALYEKEEERRQKEDAERQKEQA